MRSLRHLSFVGNGGGDVPKNLGIIGDLSSFERPQRCVLFLLLCLLVPETCEKEGSAIALTSHAEEM